MTYTEIYKIVYNFHRQAQKILTQKGTNPEVWESIANNMISISNQYKNDYLDRLLKLVYTEIAHTHNQTQEKNK